MPLSTSVDLKFAKTNAPSVALDFVTEQYSGRRKSLTGRTIYMPSIDLRDFRWRAVIDWLQVRVDLVDETQFQWIQDELDKHWHRKCYVVTITPGPGGVSRHFDIRFQEPKAPSDVLEACEAISSRFQMRSPPELTKMEVSIDAYPKTPNNEARARLLGVLQRTIFPCHDIFTNRMSRPRFNTARNDKPIFLFKTPRRNPDCLDSALWSPSSSPAPVDSTLSFGPVCGPVLVKAMDKVVDQQNWDENTFLALGPAEQRVRIEVTLHSEELVALGVRELNDLRSFSFTALQGRYFQFKLPTFGNCAVSPGSAINAARCALERIATEQFLSTGVIGLVAMRRARDDLRKRLRPEIVKCARREGRQVQRRRVGTGKTATLVSYEALNRLVASALSDLDKRSRRSWKKMEQSDRSREVQ